jgi:hypothetical protein
MVAGFLDDRCQRIWRVELTNLGEPKTSVPKKGLVPLMTLAALGAAIISLAASVLAVGVSLAALRQTNAAKEIANERTATDDPGQATSRSIPDQQPTTGAPRPSLTGPPKLDERTTYEVKYTKQALTMSGRCQYSSGTSMYVDLDEPRVDVESEGSDFVFRSGCNATDPAEFLLGDNVSGGQMDNPNATPQECTDRIRRAPIGEAAIPVRQGLVICLTTSYSAARARGDKWRVVLIVVTGFTDLRAVTVEATAWNIPT